jgi:alkylated DNA repair dioxygenase AlkB
MAQLQMPFAQVPGLIYQPEFISDAEETEIVDFVCRQEHWTAFGTRKRRLIFGHSYAVGSRTVEFERAIPPIMATLAARLQQAGMLNDIAEQVVVQDYPARIGIGKHIDSLAFGPEVVTVSLLSSCVMRFRNILQPKQRIDVLLERRSAAAIMGPARTEWTHEIIPRTVVARRLSIAFRTVARKAA